MNNTLRAIYLDEIPNLTLEDLQFSVKIKYALKSQNITTLMQLLQLTEAEFISFKRIGRYSVNEVKQKLAYYGLNLKKH